jgi:hypothetical protein
MKDSISVVVNRKVGLAASKDENEASELHCAAGPGDAYYRYVPDGGFLKLQIVRRNLVALVLQSANLIL